MSPEVEPKRSEPRPVTWIQVWKEVVCPAASAIKSFAWDVAFFYVLLKLFSFGRLP
jgi:hypothetical protein